MEISGKHVVITGGTGALGTAVVTALIAAGATCTVPYVHEHEAQRFPPSPSPTQPSSMVWWVAPNATKARSTRPEGAHSPG